MGVLRTLSLLWLVGAGFVAVVAGDEAEETIRAAEGGHLPAGDGRRRGDTLVERREESIVRILTRHLPPRSQGRAFDALNVAGEAELGEGEMSMDQLATVLQTLPTKWHCSANLTTFSAECCFDFSTKNDNYKINLAGCLTFKYLEKRKAINLALKINGYMIADFTYSLKKPSPLCINVTLGKACVKFHDISLHPFHGCLDFTVSFLGKEKILGSWCW